jgi:lysophospholipase L1-like esterase
MLNRGTILFVLILPLAALAEDKPVLKKGDRLVIAGDSITEQKLYSRYIETYLTACHPELDLWILQLGWGGETAGGFLNRMETDLLAFKPNVVTTCYGMNDGGYRAFDKIIGDNYRRNMNQIIERAKKSGAFVVVGSPGVVDSKFFGGGGERATVYNDNLAHLRDIARELAKEHGMAFANVHDAMFDVMPVAKKAMGDAYPIGGGDGVHPNANGQLIMAYAFLKALNPGGDIGTITIDGGKVEVSDGHKVVSHANHVTEIESTRYPFCFSGDKKAANSSRSILPFVPFQQELNRFMLVMKDAKADKVKVTWGKESKTFSKEQLEKGVNLAAEFDETPFADAFQKVDDLVGKKQVYETTLIKQYHQGLRMLQGAGRDDPESAEMLNKVAEKLHAKQAQMSEETRKAVVPIKHTLKIEIE